MWDTIWNVIQVSFWGLMILGLVISGISTYIRWIRSISRLRVRVISIIGLVLMVGGLIFFFSNFSNIRVFHPISRPPTTISYTKVSNLTIEVTWRSEQEIGSLNPVTVVLLPTSSSFPKDGSGQTQVSSQPTPVGTPDVPIIQAFGTHYDASAKADLQGNGAFQVFGPQPQLIQSLDQPGKVSFGWTVKPLPTESKSPPYLTLSIIGIWSPKGWEGNMDKCPSPLECRPLLDYKQLNVEVTDPAPPTPLSGLVLGLLVTIAGPLITLSGLIVNLYLVWFIRKKRREEQHFQEEGKLLSVTEEDITSYINIYLLCSSNPRDVKYLDELKKHLNPLARRLNVLLRAKKDIPPGANQEQELSTYIDQAHLILCLVSPDFLESDQCYEEMNLVTKRMDAGEVVVIPLLIRSVHGWQDTPLGKLQPLPRDEKPLSARRDWEKVMRDIAQDVQHIVEQLRQCLDGKGS
jgi:hypothetical protein